MERNRLFGIGEPLTMRAIDGDLDALDGIKLMDAVGFSAMREWMHITTLLENATTPKPDVVAAYTRTLDRCAELDIEVTGMSHTWFLADGTPSHSEMYARDITPGSDYMKTMEMLETSWYTLVSCFPQVPMWEVGNEWNIDIFLRPIGWRPTVRHDSPDYEPGFSLEEKMDIVTDMMYFSAKGIRAANPKAKVVSFSPTPGGVWINNKRQYYIPAQFGIAQSLEMVYQRIESGKFWSDKSDDFFDLLAWHPYLGSQMSFAPIVTDFPATKIWAPDELPDAKWVGYNDAAYNVMVRHGDGHKQVLLTEFGYSDCGDPAREQQQAGLWIQTFEQVKRHMPYVRTLHSFRLLEQESMLERDIPGEIGGKGEVYFGIFREKQHNFEPRTKAYALQKVCGGTKDLAKLF